MQSGGVFYCSVLAERRIAERAWLHTPLSWVVRETTPRAPTVSSAWGLTEEARQPGAFTRLAAGSGGRGGRGRKPGGRPREDPPPGAVGSHPQSSYNRPSRVLANPRKCSLCTLGVGAVTSGCFPSSDITRGGCTANGVYKQESPAKTSFRLGCNE